MMEFKTLGAIMIAPTLLLAVYLVIKTIGTRDFYLNMAIFFWITANSFWMIMEFFNDDMYRHYAAIPFGLGFVFVILFYVTAGKAKEIHHID
ncbi:MAG: hypothetical protein K0S32_3659 [Bacteroidetes bacterium]|nr:hypothetical protein [Bacteroidota bacterium]